MLKARKKLTKKELKHDPLLDTLERGKDFFEDNKQSLSTGIIAVIVVLLLAWGWMNSRKSTNNEAMLASTKASLAALTGMNDQVLSELENVVADYGNNAHIALVKLQLANVKLDSGDVEGARELYSDLAAMADPQLKQAGTLKLAYLAEREQNFAEAASLYRKVANSSKSSLSNHAKLQAGHAFLAAGNRAQAEIILSELKSTNPSGAFKESVDYYEGKVLEK